MPDLSNNSFIPKRGPAKRRRVAASRQVYIFTLISYILMFATLLATGGVYFYQEYVNTQLQKEVSNLNAAISSFSDADMQRVLEFDSRLTQASGRLDKSVSVLSIFQAFEQATVDTVQINNLELERVGDEEFFLSAAIQTDSFDSTIFQRGVFERNETIQSVEIPDVMTSETNNQLNVSQSSNKPIVSFDAELIIPLSAVPFEPNKETIIEAITITESVLDEVVLPGQEASEGEEVNENDI